MIFCGCEVMMMMMMQQQATLVFGFGGKTTEGVTWGGGWLENQRHLLGFFGNPKKHWTPSWSPQQPPFYEGEVISLTFFHGQLPSFCKVNCEDLGVRVEKPCHTMTPCGDPLCEQGSKCTQQQCCDCLTLLPHENVPSWDHSQCHVCCV